MQKYKKNINKINDLLIKNSDMNYEMKSVITGFIKEALELTHDENYKLVSKLVIDSLENRFGGFWICIIGTKFVANITHQPGNFLRVSNEKRHFVIYKMKENNQLTPMSTTRKRKKSVFSNPNTLDIPSRE